VEIVKPNASLVEELCLRRTNEKIEGSTGIVGGLEARNWPLSLYPQEASSFNGPGLEPEPHHAIGSDYGIPTPHSEHGLRK